MSLEFEHPALLLVAFCCVVTVWLSQHLSSKKFFVKIPLGPPGGAVFTPSHRIGLLVRILHTMEYVALIVLGIAMAGPVLTTSEIRYLDRGADILFVFDISPSMSALDMDGKSRFTVGKEMIQNFAQLRPNDAMGLVLVGSDAAVVLPPTIDRRVLLDRLATIKIAEMGDGTALGEGLALAALHLRHSQAPQKVVVLITDGENTAGSVHPVTAATVLQETGISFWVIGLGTSGEVPIDYVDPQTGQRRTGIFESHYSVESLKAITDAGGGTFWVADSVQNLSAAFERLNISELSFSRTQVFQHRVPLYHSFVLCALCILLCARFFKHIVLGALL